MDVPFHVLVTPSGRAGPVRGRRTEAGSVGSEGPLVRGEEASGHFRGAEGHKEWDLASRLETVEPDFEDPSGPRYHRTSTAAAVDVKTKPSEPYEAAVESASFRALVGPSTPVGVPGERP